MSRHRMGNVATSGEVNRTENSNVATLEEKCYDITLMSRHHIDVATSIVMPIMFELNWNLEIFLESCLFSLIVIQ